MFAEVNRVSIDTDENWTTHFISWLESNERNKIGTEDGVYVATVNPQLRVLQPNNEDSFVKECVVNHLSKLSGQKLKRFPVKGLYHLGSQSVSEEQSKAFREQSSCLQSYKESTCCTELLERENGLELMLKHVFHDIHDEAEQLRSAAQRRYTTSQVLLDDLAVMLRNKHKMLSESSGNFVWEGDKDAPPKQCPDIECSTITDSEESDDSDMEDLCELKPKVKDTSFKQMYGYATVSHHHHLKITNNLNLSQIYNILWLIPDFYGGLHSTYLYFGARHALFSVHVEDGLTWSVNYLHIGHPKVWIIIPPWATDLLDYHLHKSGLYLNHSKCRNLLGHKVLFPTTDWLKERGIPYKIVVQRPGDLVILYPNSAHFGLNLGNNIAEAVNVGTVSWLPWAINAKKCTCFLKPTHLNVIPLVAAFREDLLPAVLQGRHVLTPFFLRGVKLLHNEVAKMHGVHTEWANGNEHDRGSNKSNQLYLKNVKEELGRNGTFKCPAKKCNIMFPSSHNSKPTMIRHVKRDHKPILESSSLLDKIEKLFAK